MELDSTIFNGNALKKETFINAYESTFGNITESCKIAQIDRGTYYNWIKSDESFKETVDSIEPEEMALDFAEKQLFKRIKGESDACLIFFLKTKGKGRGYVEKIQTEEVGNKPKRYILKESSND